MLTLAINSVRVRDYPVICNKSWDNGTVSHHFYYALLPKLVCILQYVILSEVRLHFFLFLSIWLPMLHVRVVADLLMYTYHNLIQLLYGFGD